MVNEPSVPILAVRHSQIHPSGPVAPESFSFAGLLLSRFPGLRGQESVKASGCPADKRRTLVRAGYCNLSLRGVKCSA